MDSGRRNRCSLEPPPCLHLLHSTSRFDRFGQQADENNKFIQQRKIVWTSATVHTCLPLLPDQLCSTFPTLGRRHPEPDGPWSSRSHTPHGKQAYLQRPGRSRCEFWCPSVQPLSRPRRVGLVVGCALARASRSRTPTRSRGRSFRGRLLFARHLALLPASPQLRQPISPAPPNATCSTRPLPRRYFFCPPAVCLLDETTPICASISRPLTFTPPLSAAVLIIIPPAQTTTTPPWLTVTLACLSTESASLKSIQSCYPERDRACNTTEAGK